ncbi:peptide/nickel transport system substrate-binding protein [Caldicoprobacter guelmensis]|uniref:ABC transporter substrate-binding protein n=1 Tax=Caldicoprobacter guelmensis TaxID=1170224 RepID=UPI00195E9FC4|nr:ABC transporter substrate-binding protein [Caldicoprobacter guelmensis]MBM7582190.1 peptide/nickel transport system substrate-binding protein [Caldicoprobacter guelmensis]
MKKWLALLLLIMYTLSLTSCQLVEAPSIIEQDIGIDESKGEKVQVPMPKKGGELVVPIPLPDTLNPLLTKSRDMINFFGLIFEGLFEYDENMKPQPCLAESWDVEDGGKLWRFHLRKNVVFHDGRPLTGDDVVFTFLALQGGRLGSFYQKGIAGNANIQKVETDPFDPYTVNVYLSQPVNNILDIMTFPVLPKRVYQSDEFMLQHRQDMSLIPIGTGPYRIDDGGIQQAEGGSGLKQIRLVRNEKYWGKQPYIDAILARVYHDEMQVRQAFHEGQIDLMNVMATVINPYPREEDAKTYRYLTRNYEFLAFNMNHPVLSNVNVRKAIAYALDRKDIIFKVYLNNAEAVDVPIPSDSWLYDSSYRIYDYDPNRAVELLEQAGWTLDKADQTANSRPNAQNAQKLTGEGEVLEEGIDDDGHEQVAGAQLLQNEASENGLVKNYEENSWVRYKMIGSQKVELRFSILTNSENILRKDALEIIAQQLKRVGIAVEVEVLPWEELTERLKSGQFEAVLTGYYLDIFPDVRFMFHSRQIGNGLNNFMRYRNEELDKLLDEAALTCEDAKLIELYSRIQKHLVEQLPVVSLCFQTASLVTSEKVYGVKSPREFNIYRNIEEWYLSE